ncbi:MAG: hypothetical protein JST30_01230 [Armatimonadetes bacterium]|nr:hypothetical protein [Armatimonadota bacterium]
MSDHERTGIREDRWRIQTLGAFKVSLGQRSAAFPTRKAAGMLAYLAYYSGKAVPRDVLAGVFWPDSGPDRARQSVRNALTQIRTSLKHDDFDVDGLFLASAGTVECREGSFHVDAAEFRRSAEALIGRPDSVTTSELIAAFDLYQGPFLPGFDEEWVVPQLLDLEELFVTFAEKLCERLIAEDLTEQAVATGRKAVTVCPLREECHVALMKAYAAEGRTSAVFRQFEALEKMMDGEWGEPPSTAAVQILESLPSADRPPARSTKGGSGASRPATGRLFGRDEASEELTGWLKPGGAFRSVTLVGMGGLGKTALAEQTLAELATNYPGRCWNVPMVALQSALQIPEAVLDVVGKARPMGPDPIDDVARAIGPGPAIVLFDNVEQLLPAARQVIDGFLERLPQLRILATSRLPVGCRNERVWPIRPVALPTDPRNLEALRENPSVKMLVDRAQAVRPGFCVTPVTARSVYELCHRLEGVPLAIAIAATHLATQSPAQLLGSLGRSLDLGAAGGTVPERHQSLRAVVAWNHERLAPGVKDGFERLSVCRGGFNGELGRSIVGNGSDVVLKELVSHGLLGWTETEAELRFEALETVRDYTFQKLSERPDALLEAVEAHFRYCEDLAQDPTSVSDPAAWTQRVEADLANVLEALAAAASGRIEAGRGWSLAQSLKELIRRRGRSHVWSESFAKLLEGTDPAIDAVTRAEAHLLLSQTNYGMRDIAATYRHSLEAVTAADASGDDKLRAVARIETAIPGSLLGRFEEARAHLESARTMLDDAGDTAGLADCEINLGWLEFDSGDEEAARATLLAALRHAEETGDGSLVSDALVAYGSALGPGLYDEAAAHMDRALAIREGLGYPQQVAHALYYRAFLDYRAGRSGSALGGLVRSLDLFVSNGIRLGQTPLSVSGLVFAAIGQPLLAAAFWGRALESCRRYGMQMFPVVKACFESERERAVASSGALAWEAALQRGALADDETLLAMVAEAERTPSAVVVPG